MPPKHIPLWSAALVWQLTYGFSLENRIAVGFPMGLSLLCLLRTHSPEDQSDDQSQNGGSHPAETDGCKGQDIAHRGDQSVRVEQRPDALRQCPQEIVQRRHQRQPGDPAVHRPVVVKEPAQQRQQDQRSKRGDTCDPDNAGEVT